MLHLILRLSDGLGKVDNAKIAEKMPTRKHGGGNRKQTTKASAMIEATISRSRMLAVLPELCVGLLSQRFLSDFDRRRTVTLQVIGLESFQEPPILAGYGIHESRAYRLHAARLLLIFASHNLSIGCLVTFLVLRGDVDATAESQPEITWPGLLTEFFYCSPTIILVCFRNFFRVGCFDISKDRTRPNRIYVYGGILLCG
jgi:hypothetical protein